MTCSPAAKRLGPIWVALTVLLAPWAAAQVPSHEPPRRLRVGLVLGGGGARGCAHIGVLKVLEELHVPVDAIAGTSMGALVGGLYASGLSPEEIEKAVLNADWNDLFTDTLAREDLPFRRKEDTRRYIEGLEVGYKDGHLVAPRGFIVGNKLAFLMRSTTLATASVTDFDQLAIPYRAVATDIGTGEAVVLSQGDLVEAMRASISIPGVFSPVEIDGHLLVDGGLVDNVPVDVARAMGVDVVIAVDVGGRLADAERLRTAFGISKQVMSLLSRKNAEVQVALADILISPDLKGFTAAQFGKAAEIIPRGEAAARENLEAIAVYASDETAWQEYMNRRCVPQGPIRIDSVQVEGAEHIAARRITSLLRVRPGEALDLQLLRRDLERLYAMGDVERVDFRLLTDADGTALIIQLKEKPWGPTIGHMALNLGGDFEGEASYGVVVGITRGLVNRLGAEWRNEVELGRTNRLTSEFYQPLDYRGVFFLSLNADIQRTPVDIYDQELHAVVQYQTLTALGGFNVGAQLGTWGEVFAGVRSGHAWLDRRIGDPAYPDIDLGLGGAAVGLAVDRVDSPDFPSKGYYAFLESVAYRMGLGSDVNTYNDTLEAGYFRTPRRTTYFGELKFGTSSDEGYTGISGFSEGGLWSFSGFDEGSLYGTQVAVLRLGSYHTVGQLPGALGSRVLAGGWVEAGNVWATRDDVSLDDLKVALTLLLGAETSLGPAYLAIGSAHGGSTRVYLNLGHRF